MPKLRELKSPAVSSQAARYESHYAGAPPHHVRQAVSIVPEKDADAAVQKAEQALAALSAKFPMWMQAEWARLAFAHAEVTQDGFNEPATARLLRVAAEVRAHAPIYGYKAAADIAASLCRLIEEIADRDAMPRGLVMRHVDAIGAIARGVKDVPNAMELRLSATQHLLRESSIAIAAPPLVPEQS